MACVFYLPRILVNLAETQGQDTVQARLVLMGLRLYRFGHVMFAAALLFGLPLWLGYKVSPAWFPPIAAAGRSEEHTSELQSLMRISYAVFCLKKKNTTIKKTTTNEKNSQEAQNKDHLNYIKRHEQYHID